MAVLRSVLSLSLRDQVTGPLRGVTRALGAFQRENRRLAGGLMPGGSVRGMLGAYAGYEALSRAMRGTVGSAGRFEAAMNNVAAVSGANAITLGQLEAQARSLGRTTQFTATQAAASTEMLLRNGLSAKASHGGAE